MNQQDTVLAANRAFYAAFATGDLVAMKAIWATAYPVTCIHPGWAVLFGRSDVIASWRRILGEPAAPGVQMHAARAHLFADLAYVVCVEEIGGATLAATNIFIQEEGAWKLVHHQAGLVADLLDVMPDMTSGTLH